jgi:hypothetical protein
MRPRRSGEIVSFALLACVAGCTPVTDTTSTTSSVDTQGQPTVEIDPSEFLGDVLCADLSGAMKSYVATFTDWGPAPSAAAHTADTMPGYPVVLPSSPPAPCSQRVAFTNGVSGHRYTVDIDGYEQAPSEMVPACSQTPKYAPCFGQGQAPLGAGLCNGDADCFALGCYGQCVTEQKQVLTSTASGNICDFPKDANHQPIHEKVDVCIYTPVVGDRHMVLPGTDTGVSPRWTTPKSLPCGWDKPATAVGYTRVEITGCAKLDDHGGSSVTGIRVTLTDPTLDGLACYAVSPDGGITGSVTTYDVTMLGSSLPPVTDTACAEKQGPLFTQGVVAGAQYKFKLDVHENGQAMPTRTTTCYAVAKDGLIVPATCDPLLPVGP